MGSRSLAFIGRIVTLAGASRARDEAAAAFDRFIAELRCCHGGNRSLVCSELHDLEGGIIGLDRALAPDDPVAVLLRYVRELLRRALADGLGSPGPTRAVLPDGSQGPVHAGTTAASGIV